MEMGIPGLYEQIGAGERVALSKLAVEHYKATGRKFRVAIDASIWLFQVKAGQGGVNPELRTLYYRLVRLLGLGIEPVFVFDGKDRPSEKRNKKVTGKWESTRAREARTLLDLFGFVHHRAPGEAEAECALIQREGVVDAVFSEDVDTLMFGATMTLRNWSKQDTRGSKPPTHINVFRASTIKAKTGLDREGMILVALMSGGDYDTEGINRCGHKTAYEAAKAGFGHDLCALKSNDMIGIVEWQERLQHELKTNESGFFRTKHPGILIQPSFPRRVVLNNYLLPLISPVEELDELKRKLLEYREPQIMELRNYVANKFEWETLAGAKKFIRGLAPALLTQKLLVTPPVPEGPQGLLSVCGSRVHHTSDGIPESRLELVPITLVPINLNEEPLRRTGHEEEAQILSDLEVSELETSVPSSQAGRERSVSPVKRRNPSNYNPNEPCKVFIPDFYVRLGAPSKVEEWERAQLKPRPASPKKPRTRTVVGDRGMHEGAIESFFSIKKAAIRQAAPLEHSASSKTARQTQPRKSRIGPEKDKNGDVTKNPWTFTKDARNNQRTLAEIQDAEHIMRRELHPELDKNDLMAQYQAESGEKTQPCPTNSLPGHSNDQDKDAYSSPLSSQDLLHVTTSSGPKAFSSPLSSQELLIAENKPLSYPPLPSSAVRSHIRIRESLEGSWAVESPARTGRVGTRLRNVDVVDLT